MMGGALSGRAIFGTQPNVLFDASNYSKGQNDALAIQKNRLMLDRAQMENANDQAFRSAAPGAIGGDPAAMTAAVQADPDRALALQTQLANLDSGRRKKALESMTILGQGAASLLALPDDQAAATYPGLIDRFKGMGLDTSALPPAYPGRAAVETFARGLTPIMDQLKAQDERVVPAGDMSQPRGLRNNNPLNIEAGAFTKSMPGFKGSDGRFAVFESPDQGIAAADALLMRYAGDGRNTPARIIEKWAPAGDGNNVSAYAGSVAKALGIGPNDPIPMEDPAARRALIDAMSAVENGKRGPQPLVRQGNGMPVTQGAQPGMMWAQGPGGQRVQMPIPGAGERIKPPEGFRYSADGTQFEAIPGGPNDPNYKAQIKAAERGDGPYQGTAMDAQDANILLRGDPTTQEYAAAFNRQNSPRFFPDGSRVDPNMSAYRPPQYAGPGAPQPQQQDGQPSPQPAAAPAGGMTRVPQQAPATVVTGMLENAASLQKIDDAFAALASPDAKGSVGPLAGGLAGLPFVGQAAINTLDPKGVAVRAIIADIGSLKVHDRSGAAVAASEQPRLRPFIPSASDDPQTVRTKLQNFRREYAAIMRDTYSVFGPDGGYKALPVIENTLRRVEQPAEQSGGVKDGAIAVNDETGERLIRRNGQWVPAP